MARTIPRFTRTAASDLSMATDWTAAADFDMSLWVWSSDGASGAISLLLGDDGRSVDYVAYYQTRLRFNIGGVNNDSAAGVMIAGVFNYVQITRVGTLIEMYANGVLALSFNDASSFTINRIGSFSSGTLPFDGFIKDVALLDDTTPANSRSWLLDEPTAATENSTQGGNAVTYNNIAASERPEFTESGDTAYWWNDDGDVLETSEEQNTSIIFEIGQSNDVGLAPVGVGIDDVYSTLNGRIRQFGFSSQIREGATNPLDHNDPTTGTMGHWRTMCLGLTGNKLLVPAAQSSTGFSTNNWNPGDTIYNQAIASLTAAIATRSGQSIEAIVWHQGERDGLDANTGYLADRLY